MGRGIDKNGSKVMEMFPQAKHSTVDLSWPYIKSTIIDLFLA